MTCSICDHPDVQAINTALRAETPLRHLESQWGVSRSALDRHRHDHLMAATAPLMNSGAGSEPPRPTLCPLQDWHTFDADCQQAEAAIPRAAQRYQAAVAELLDAGHEAAMLQELAQFHCFTRPSTPLSGKDPQEMHAWFARPEASRKRMDAAKTERAYALSHLTASRNALESLIAQKRAYDQRWGYLQTEAGQQLDNRYRALLEELADARRTGNNRRQKACENDLENLRRQFDWGAQAHKPVAAA